MKNRKSIIFFGLLFALALQSFGAKPVNAADQPIYVVDNWVDYLRLVPVSERDGYKPLLYNPSQQPTAEIYHFAALYGGDVTVVGKEAVDALMQTEWATAKTVIVAGKDGRFGLVAAALAAALDAPLYFETLPPEVASNNIETVIAVGQVAPPAGFNALVLGELEAARAYYNDLVGPAPVAVLAADDEMGFLAATIVAHHRGNLLFAPEEIRDYQPQYLAWVTRPQSVRTQAVRNLYDASRLMDDAPIYDTAVGVLTAFNPHDLSLLLARTYVYPQLAGEWKTAYLYASSDSPSAIETESRYPYEVVTVGGKSATGTAVTDLLHTSGHVMLEGHGSPSGIALADGSWPTFHDLTGLPPLVFVAESCETLNFDKGIGNSFALELIAGGAVAYVGSIDIGGVGIVGSLPFADSTPSLPLGELVRLQIAARMDIDADYPRAILLGEPTFYQNEQTWFEYVISSDADTLKVDINPQNGVETPFLLSLQLPKDANVAFVEALRPGKETVAFAPGMVYVAQSFASAPTFVHDTILLEWPGGVGELRLHTTLPLPWRFYRLLSNSLLGTEALLIDLASRPGVGPLLMLLSLGASIALFRRKRKTLQPSQIRESILTGVGITVLWIYYCLALDFFISWAVVTALACNAVIAVWLVSPRQFWPVRAALRFLLFMLPISLLWLVAALVGGSQKVLVLVADGLGMIGLAFGLVVLLAMWLSNKLARRDAVFGQSPATRNTPHLPTTNH